MSQIDSKTVGRSVKLIEFWASIKLAHYAKATLGFVAFNWSWDHSVHLVPNGVIVHLCNVFNRRHTYC